MASIRERLQADLPAAMKEKDAVRIAVLRSALAALANAEAVDATSYGRHVNEVARKELTEDDCRAILSGEQAEIAAAERQVRAHGRRAEADDLALRSAILASYL